jgi:hypothetical protein
MSEAGVQQERIAISETESQSQPALLLSKDRPGRQSTLAITRLHHRSTGCRAAVRRGSGQRSLYLCPFNY